MSETLRPKEGFDWTRVAWTGPHALVEWEVCSYCGGSIGEDDVPLRMWNDNGWAAVFCDACMAEWFGMERMPEMPDDDYDDGGVP